MARRQTSARRDPTRPPPSRNKERDEAIDLVRRALYGAHYIEQPTHRQWKLALALGDDPVRLSGRDAPRQAQARVQWVVYQLQIAQVVRYLLDHGVDAEPRQRPPWSSGFDKQAFDTFYRKRFGSLPGTSSKQQRIDAVKAVLKRCTPGRGGDVGWKAFCDQVRRASGQKCHDMTIRRDVKGLTGR